MLTFASAIVDSHFFIISVMLLKFPSVCFIKDSFVSLSVWIMPNSDSKAAIFWLIPDDLFDISSNSLESDSQRCLSSSILSVFTFTLFSFLSIFTRTPDRACLLPDMFSSRELILSRCSLSSSCCRLSSKESWPSFCLRDIILDFLSDSFSFTPLYSRTASFISSSFIFSNSARNLSALWACLSIEFIWRFISFTISAILTRLLSVFSSLLRASFLLALYFVIPLASSKISRLSSGRE